MSPWLLTAAKLALAPVLLWQGRQVRRNALRLPEAEGPREGVAGTGKVCLRVLIVGDSSAAGVGAKNQTQALAGRLSEALSQRLGGAVVWQLIARSGDTTRVSLNAVRKSATTWTGMGRSQKRSCWLRYFGNWYRTCAATWRCRISSKLPPRKRVGSAARILGGVSGSALASSTA